MTRSIQGFFPSLNQVGEKITFSINFQFCTEGYYLYYLYICTLSFGSVTKAPGQANPESKQRQQHNSFNMTEWRLTIYLFRRGRTEEKEYLQEYLSSCFADYSWLQPVFNYGNECCYYTAEGATMAIVIFIQYTEDLANGLCTWCRIIFHELPWH